MTSYVFSLGENIKSAHCIHSSLFGICTAELIQYEDDNMSNNMTLLEQYEVNNHGKYY